MICRALISATLQNTIEGARGVGVGVGVGCQSPAKTDGTESTASATPSRRVRGQALVLRRSSEQATLGIAFDEPEGGDSALLVLMRDVFIAIREEACYRNR